MAGLRKKPVAVQDLIESPTVLASGVERAGRFMQRHRKKLLGVGVVLLLCWSAFFLYKDRRRSRDRESQVELFQAVHYFEAQNFPMALDGDGNSLGFRAIISEYNNTQAANLAFFYMGSIYLQQQNFDGAVACLSKFSSDDVLIQGRAYALRGDAYMEKQNYAQAVIYYRKAAHWHPNEYFSPTYLSKACIAYKKMGDVSAATDCYREIVDGYFGTAEHKEAVKELARLSAE